MKALTTVALAVGLLVLAVIAIKVIGWLLGSFLWLAVVVVVAFVAYSIGKAAGSPTD